MGLSSSAVPNSELSHLISGELKWSDWLPLSRGSLPQIPRRSGLYRTRALQHSGLVYIGQTGRSLRERLSALCAGTHARDMPYNDPHTAAPGHWAYRVEDGFEYELSFVEMACDRRGLLTCESLLLAQHRRRYGTSTLLNVGRFHRMWSRPRNRSTGDHGQRRGTGSYNPASDPSRRPLQPRGEPGDDCWMGLPWSPLVSLLDSVSSAPAGSGLYIISDADDVIYIGQSQSLRQRLRQHRGQLRRSLAAQVRWTPVEDTPEFRPHHLLELEADLLGAFIEARGDPPRKQFESKRSGATR